MKHFSCLSTGVTFSKKKFVKTWLTGNLPLESRGKRFKHFREKYIVYYEEKEVAVMSPGGRSQHLRWCHIRNKTERLSGGKRTVQDYTFSF
nr:MAG TPA: hypothetical protein [Caudoviricetes sp.]